MPNRDTLSDATRERLLEVLDDAREILKLVEELALRRGMSSEWALFSGRLELLRAAVKDGKSDPDLMSASIETFTDEYDAFIEVVLPEDELPN